MNTETALFCLLSINLGLTLFLVVRCFLSAPSLPGEPKLKIPSVAKKTQSKPKLRAMVPHDSDSNRPAS